MSVPVAHSTLHRVRGAGVAAAVAGTVVLARTEGLLSGWAAIILAGFLVTLTPAADTLSHRWATAAGLLPWLAVLWWVRFPIGGPGRVTVLLAAGAAALSGSIAADAAPCRRLRQLMPDFRLVDSAPLIAGGIACWPLRPWLRASGTPEALAALIPGWDNSAHFAMTEMVLHRGAVTAALPTASDGSAWGFTEYPQHFHTAVAALIELFYSPVPRSPVQTLVPYAHAMGAVLVLATIGVVAAVSSLPSARRHPLSTTVLAVLLTTIYTYGPGLRSVQAGHVNFLVAAETTVLAAALAVRVIADGAWIDLAALGGAVVAVANEWLPLAAMAMTAFGWALLVRRWSSRTELGVVATLTAATILASLAVLPRLLALDVGRVLVLNGAVPMEHTYLAVGVPILASVLAVGAAQSLGRAAATRAGDSALNSERRAAWGLALMPLVGLCLFAAVLTYQVRQAGYPSYYSIKMLNGTLLVSWGVAVIAIISMCSGERRRPRPWTTAGVHTILVASVLASGVSGSTEPEDADTAPGRTLAADRLLKAVGTAHRHPAGQSFYLAIAPGDPHVVNADQWFTALTGSWTRARSTIDARLTSAITSTEQMAQAVDTVLRAGPTMVVIVNPADVAWLRRELPLEERARLLTWQ